LGNTKVNPQKKVPIKPTKKKKGYWSKLDPGERRRIKAYIYLVQIIVLVIIIINAMYESIVFDPDKFYLPLGFYIPMGYLLLLILFLSFLIAVEGLWFKYLNIKTSRSFEKRFKLIKNYQGTSQKVMVVSLVIIIIFLSMSFLPFFTDALKTENNFEVSPNNEEDSKFEFQDALGITEANTINVDSNNSVELTYGKKELEKDLDNTQFSFTNLGNHTSTNVELSRTDYQLGYAKNNKYYFIIKNVGNTSVSGKYTIERNLSKTFVFNIILFMILFLVTSVVWLAYLSTMKKKYETLHEKKVEELTKKYAVKPYTIEDVFLIHKDGTLLTHQTRRLKPMDNDILSAMLTAIKDFIKDAFKADSKGELNELKYGKLDIFIEHGQFAFLAVVVSGSPPKDLRQKMRALVAGIHQTFYNELKVFKGIPKKFEPVKRMIFQQLLDSKCEGTYIDEGSDSFWNNKGVVQTKLGKYNDAVECFDRALRVNPGVSNIWLNRGIALVKLEEYEEAMDCFDRALQLDKNNESAKRRRNKCWYKWKLMEGREGYTDKSYSRHPQQYDDYGYDDYGGGGRGQGPGVGPAADYGAAPVQAPAQTQTPIGTDYMDEPPPRCPDCGQPLRYVDEYESWYCDPCDIYPYDD
jgi:tetratricopeptide (TPR) repeat protein